MVLRPDPNQVVIRPDPNQVVIRPDTNQVVIRPDPGGHLLAPFNELLMAAIKLRVRQGSLDLPTG